MSKYILLFLFAFFALSAADNHYKEGEVITLWVDKVGPIDNPQETYQYFSLPFCSPKEKLNLARIWERLSKVMNSEAVL